MRPFLRTFSLLCRRKLLSAKGGLRAMTGYERGRNLAFLLAGFWMLAALHYGSRLLLLELASVQLIGELLLWKLTAMAMLATFAMVVLSSLIISMTTLFYASDLRFLLRSPAPLRAVFLDKALEAAFFSSWMIALVLLPYLLALGRVQGHGPGFYAAFLALFPPFLALAAVLGLGFTLALMYAFPSSRTRDAVWILSSFSVALVYALLRFSEPERLLRPDALGLVAEYLKYLQAPTAPYAPSWWLLRGWTAWIQGRPEVFWEMALRLYAAAAVSWSLLLWAAGRAYAHGYSGAQEGRRMGQGIDIPPFPEVRLAALAGVPRAVAALFWKERKAFFRDVKHWSQIVLVLALAAVYLFSVSRLPLGNAELRSMVCFLNLAAAGFVLSSLGLRFTFPSVSLEGRSFWVVRSAPVSLGSLLAQKFLFSLFPMLVLATALVAVSNRLLGADAFISRLTLGTIWAASGAICAMGVGFGALFPRFNVENIHQVESSAGGFVYMACCLGYIGATVAAEAWPVQMHFQERLGRAGAWDWRYACASLAFLAPLNAAAYGLPLWLGLRSLKAHEGH